MMMMMILNSFNMVEDIKNEFTKVVDTPAEYFEIDVKTEKKENEAEHAASKKLHICFVCNLNYKSKNALSQHYQSVHDGFKYICNICDKEYKWRDNLRKHKQSIHSNITFQCDLCDFKSTDKGNLKKHWDSKHEGFKHACTINVNMISKNNNKLSSAQISL